MTRLLRQFEKLEELRGKVIDELRSRTDEELQEPLRKGGWSALEIIEHLSVAEEGSLIYIRRKIDVADSLPMAGLGATLRSTVLSIALRLPFRYKAPEVVATPRPAESLNQAVARWDQIRAEWRSTIESFPEELRSRAIFRHPVAGLMNISNTLGFHRNHLLRHREQIRRGLRVMATRPPSSPTSDGSDESEMSDS